MSHNINSIDLSGLSKQYAARDLPSNLKLKYRESGQAAPEEVRKDKKELRKDLEEREKIATNKSDSKRLSIADKEADKPTTSKKQKVEQPVVVNLDADEVLPDSDSDDDVKHKKRNSDDESDESDDDNADDDDNNDDDEDDTEALMAELNRIKKERAAEAARQEAERKAREEKIRVENILKGNPLLNPSTSKAGASSGVDFKVKRRWDDDVVFKNCAKLDDNKKKDFINDTLRSEFHKKFMDRYIK